MNKACGIESSQLLMLAEGQDIPELQQHVANCPACASTLEALSKVLSALATPVFEAPGEAILRAQQLMPETARRTARLIAWNLGLAGVRSAAPPEFQLVYEDPEFRLRLLHTKSESGWSVTGRIEPPDRGVAGPEGQVAADEAGRFSFEAADLDQTELTITCPGGQVHIPPASEAQQNGPESGR